jgi:hypothetical protein
MSEVWSFGGGVQSVAIGALILQGRLPMPDFAVIADTGYERSSTWEYLRLMQAKLPIQRVSASDFATVGLWGGKGKDTLLIPAFSDFHGTPAKLSGYCSNEWKTRVIDRWLKQQGVKTYRRWLGFSTDELKRAKDHSAHFPLIELGMSRNDCLALIDSMGWPLPPRSSCYMCPNHGDEEWREIQTSEDWPLVVAFDEAIRKRDPNLWLTRRMTPIKDEDFSDPNGDLFRDSGCESGVCFV